MLVIKEQRYTWYEERPATGGGQTPPWKSVSNNCAEDSKAKGWILDGQNLYLPLKAMGSDKVTSHHLLKSMNISISIDSFHRKKDHMSRKTEGVDGAEIPPIFPPIFYYEDFQTYGKVEGITQ